jgi:hypothetical protein
MSAVEYRIEPEPADDSFYGHCECGCGTSLWDREHCKVHGITLWWRALNMEHACRILGRITRHPFECSGSVLVTVHE